MTTAHNFKHQNLDTSIAVHVKNERSNEKEESSAERLKSSARRSINKLRKSVKTIGKISMFKPSKKGKTGKKQAGLNDSHISKSIKNRSKKMDRRQSMMINRSPEQLRRWQKDGYGEKPSRFRKSASKKKNHRIVED